jgi:hypothetical protein
MLALVDQVAARGGCLELDRQHIREVYGADIVSGLIIGLTHDQVEGIAQAVLQGEAGRLQLDGYEIDLTCSTTSAPPAAELSGRNGSR